MIGHLQQLIPTRRLAPTGAWEAFMPQGGTPPLVPMWPQPNIREINQNPFPFFPFDPHWGDELPMLEFEAFCALLRLAWVSPRPCYLPADPSSLNKLLEPCRLRGGATLTEQVLLHFTAHPRTGLIYFPPQLRALERLVAGENMYSLLWGDPKASHSTE